MRIEPTGYIIITTFRRVTLKEAKKLGTNPRHPVFMAIFDEVNDKFNNIADALIEKNKREHPDDYIIIPYW